MDTSADSDSFSWKHAALCAALYLALIGLRYYIPLPQPLWLAGGIGLALLWLWGVRLWPVVFLGAWGYAALALGLAQPQISSGMLLLRSAVFALIHTGALLLGWYALRKLNVARFPLATIRDSALWVLIGGVGTALPGSVGIAGSLVLLKAPADIGATIRLYWLSGNVAASLTGAFLLAWLSPNAPEETRTRFSRVVALVLLWGGALAVFAGERYLPVLADYPLDYLLALALIVMAMLYGPRLTTLGLLGTGICATAFSLAGGGPFYSPDTQVMLFRLQLYLAVVGGIVVVLMGAVSQRMAAERSLRRSLDFQQEQNRRLSLLNTITTRALSASSEAELLQMLADNLGELWHAQGCYLTLWDEVNQSVLPGAAYGLFRERYRNMSPPPGEQTMTESVLRAGHPIFEADVFHPEHISPRIAEQFPQKSLLGIPLIAGGRWLGAVLIAFGEKARLADDELAWAQQVGAQIALALQNVQLYNRTLNSLRRERHLAALSRVFAENLDPRLVLQQATDLMMELVDADAGALALISEDGQYMTYPYVNGLPASLTEERIPRQGGGLAWQLVESGRPLLLEDYRRHLNALSSWSEQDIQAFLGAPIQAREQYLGAIGLFRKPGRPAFTLQDAGQIVALGRQAGLIIQNALLYRQERTLRKRAEVLRAIAVDMGTGHDLKEMMTSLLQHLDAIVPFDSASVFLAEEEGLRLVMGHNLRKPEAVLGRLFPLDSLLFREIQRTARPLLLDDPAAHPGFEGWGGTSDVQRWLGVPLIVEEQVIGYITLDRFTPRMFDEEEVALAQAVASQAAALIAHQNLYLQTEQRARELSMLYEFSRQFASQVNPEQIARQTCQLAVERLHVTYAWLGLVPSGQVRLQPYGFAHREIVTPAQHISERAMPLAQTAFVQRALRVGAPVLVESVQDDDTLSETDRTVLAALGAERLVAFSLRHGAKVFGVLLLGDSEERQDAISSHLRFLQSLASQVAVALENARLFADTNRHLVYMQALHTIDMTINASLDLDVTLSVLVRQLINHLKVDAVAVFVLDSSTNLLSCRISEGFHAVSPITERLRLGQGRAGKIALTRQPMYVPDLSGKEPVGEYTASLIHEEGFVSYYGAPLIAKGQVNGVLEVYTRTPLRPDNLWMEFIGTAAAQAAIAMDNATLFQNLDRSNFDLLMAYDTTLAGWSRALELRDAETEGHSGRVTAMTLRLARAMGLSGERLTAIRYGALLHDIGKMGIPDRILYKAGPLTEEEWEIMRQHPVYAYNLLAPIPYLRDALDIPYCHHERWQGQGYPRGLKGEQIPLAARIFAVVDVWDALSKDRPYRKAWPQEKVKQYLREQAGIQFDPKVVEAFLRLLNKEDT